eukprot:scaffold4559_cov51-Phaeocystis_antarctica.AAC.1
MLAEGKRTGEDEGTLSENAIGWCPSALKLKRAVTRVRARPPSPAFAAAAPGVRLSRRPLAACVNGRSLLPCGNCSR